MAPSVGVGSRTTRSCGRACEHGGEDKRIECGVRSRCGDVALRPDAPQISSEDVANRIASSRIASHHVSANDLAQRHPRGGCKPMLRHSLPENLVHARSWWPTAQWNHGTHHSPGALEGSCRRKSAPGPRKWAPPAACCRPVAIERLPRPEAVCLSVLSGRRAFDVHDKLRLPETLRLPDALAACVKSGHAWPGGRGCFCQLQLASCLPSSLASIRRCCLQLARLHAHLPRWFHAFVINLSTRLFFQDFLFSHVTASGIPRYPPRSSRPASSRWQRFFPSPHSSQASTFTIHQPLDPTPTSCTQSLARWPECLH